MAAQNKDLEGILKKMLNRIGTCEIENFIGQTVMVAITCKRFCSIHIGTLEKIEDPVFDYRLYCSADDGNHIFLKKGIKYIYRDNYDGPTFEIDLDANR